MTDTSETVETPPTAEELIRVNNDLFAVAQHFLGDGYREILADDQNWTRGGQFTWQPPADVSDGSEEQPEEPAESAPAPPPAPQQRRARPPVPAGQRPGQTAPPAPKETPEEAYRKLTPAERFAQRHKHAEQLDNSSTESKENTDA